MGYGRARSGPYPPGQRRRARRLAFLSRRRHGRRLALSSHDVARREVGADEVGPTGLGRAIPLGRPRLPLGQQEAGAIRLEWGDLWIRQGGHIQTGAACLLPTVACTLEGRGAPTSRGKGEGRYDEPAAPLPPRT